MHLERTTEKGDLERAGGDTVRSFRCCDLASGNAEPEEDNGGVCKERPVFGRWTKAMDYCITFLARVWNANGWGTQPLAGHLTPVPRLSIAHTPRDFPDV